MFRLAVDGLRGLGTCILVGSPRSGTEVSFEMPWLQGGRTVRGAIQGDSRPRDFIPRLVDLFMAGRMPLDPAHHALRFCRHQPRRRRRHLGRCDKAGAAVAAVTAPCFLTAARAGDAAVTTPLSAQSVTASRRERAFVVDSDVAVAVAPDSDRYRRSGMAPSRAHSSRPMRSVTSHALHQFPDVGSPGQPNG